MRGMITVTAVNKIRIYIYIYIFIKTTKTAVVISLHKNMVNFCFLLQECQ